jgi:subtilisin family serine protease
MAVKFFEPPNNPTAANAFIAIAWAALRFFNPFNRSNRVKVINASWHVPVGGGGLVGLLWLLQRVTNLLGCVVVFSAGNDGTDNQIYPLFPANFSTDPQLQGRVMTVLGTDRYDNKASFSNYSPVSVNIGAPGIYVLSAGRYVVAQPERYRRYSGTSAAAAHVSSGAALVAALNPGWGPAQVVQHVLASADRMPQLMVACVDGRRLNLANAVYGPIRVTAPPRPPPPPPAGAFLAVLPAAVPFNITWNVVYDNPAFAQVSIDFVPQAGGVFPIVVAPIGPPGVGGAFLWRPDTTPLPPLPAIGTIRITPVGGNFPVHSGAIQIV